MKSLLLSLALLILCAATGGQAASTRKRVDITVTNNAATGYALTVNGSAKIWTNVTGSATIATNALGTVNATTTNLVDALSRFPFAGLDITWVSPSVVRLVAGIDQALTISQSGNWCSLVITTNPVQKLTSADWPFTSIYYATNATNQATAFVDGMSTYSASAFAANSPALTNHVNTSTEQWVNGVKRWLTTNFFARAVITNATLVNAVSISGTLGSLTNGYWTNGIAQNLTVTNLMAPGTNSGSTQIGGLAIGVNATQVGKSGIAGPASVSSGYLASAPGTNQVAIGFGSEIDPTATGATAVGQNTQVFAPGGAALGNGSVVGVGHTNSFAIVGTTTKTNQGVLGSASHIITVPGVFEAAATTNANWRGTNILNGSLAIRRFDHNSLANGANAGVILGTNNYIRIVAGPTAAFSIAGFAGGQDGLMYRLVNYTGFPMTLSNQSGTEPTAANRIITGKGGDLVITNFPGAAQIIYDLSASRWTLLGYTD